MDGGLFYLGLAASIIFGLAMGSFNNVLIYRLPRKESIVRPASRCPDCGVRIRWYDNIPLLSYLILRGRCRNCGTRISPLYPFVEVTTCALTVGVYLVYGFSWATVQYMILAWALVPVFFIDMFHYIIPDVISLPLILIGLFFAALKGSHVLFHNFIAAVVCAGGLFILGLLMTLLLRREALGMGDVKLIAGIGAFLGIQGTCFTLFLGSLLGAAASVPFLLWRKGNIRGEVPFGPFLAAGAVSYILLWPLTGKLVQSLIAGLTLY